MREKILQAAEQLFMEQGYQSTSTRQIAEVVGITQPNLYYHFKKKEDIYYGVMLALSSEVKERLTQIVYQENLPLKEKLVQMTDYLKGRHPFNFYTMMHDINHILSPEISNKLYVLFKDSYQQPFFEVFQNNEFKIRSNVNQSFAVQQMFVLIAAFLTQSPQMNQSAGTLEEALDLFLYGLVDQTGS